jgi:hypothetical protein
MTKTLTITLPDELEQALLQAAAQTDQSAEALILQLLVQKLIPASDSYSECPNDPLFQLAGSISSKFTDVAARHDYYIGQALYEEMHRDE